MGYIPFTATNRYKISFSHFGQHTSVYIMTPIRLPDKQVSHTGAIRKTNNFSSNSENQKINYRQNARYNSISPEFFRPSVIVIDILIVKVKLLQNLF